jgi:RNA polymerase sigma-70 factor (ECF subfamily)
MNEQRKSDLELVQACLGGDKSAWSRIVESYQQHVQYTVIQTLRRYGARRSAQRVEDLVSGIFLKIVEDDFRRLKTYSGRATLKTWLRSMTTNTTIDFLRKKRELLLIDDEDTHLPCGQSHKTPESIAIDRDLVSCFAQLMEELNDADRCFLELFYVEGRDFDEIADELETSTGALYARKHRLTGRLEDLAREFGVLEDFSFERSAG